MAAFAYFKRSHNGQVVVINTDHVVCLNSGMGDRTSILTLHGETYTVEVGGTLDETVEILRRAAEYADMPRGRN
jgi:hypothetical protein